MEDKWYNEVEDILSEFNHGIIDSTVCMYQLRSLGMSDEDVQQAAEIW